MDTTKNEASQPKIPAKAIAAILAIKSIESNNNGELIVLAQGHALQPTGVFRVHPVQEQRLLRRLGLTNRAQLKHLVAVTNGTSKMAVTLTECKAGDAWDNGKEGAARKSGTYEKDWVRADINELELGFAAKQMIAKAAVDSIFSDMSGYGAAVVRPNAVAAPAVAAPAVAEEHTTEEPNVG